MSDISEFTNLYQEENEKLFEQGIWLAEKCTDKKTEAEIKRQCGMETGASADTINKRLRVGRVFGDNYFVDCNWSLHVAACEIAKANGKDEQTTEAAFNLMDTAIKGYVDENGNHRPHSAATLKEQYRAAANEGNGKRETVYRGTCLVNEVMHYDQVGGNYTTLEMEMDGTIKLAEGEFYTITITRETREPQADAAALPEVA